MTDKQQTFTRERGERPKRIPIDAGNVLDAEQRPGFVRRYVNDTPGRVQRFQMAGYTPVSDPNADTSNAARDKGSNLGSSVIRRPVGGGHFAVLMEIPKDIYDEDQAAKQAMIDESERAMAPRIGDQGNDAGQYGSVTINR